MAATTGLLQASMRLQTSGSSGRSGGWPNSRMSAPAMKPRPAPTSSRPDFRVALGLVHGLQQAAARSPGR